MPWNDNYDYDDDYNPYGRGKSVAWNLDGGANDEGYYYAYCDGCNKETEHDPCSGCCEC